MTQSIDQSDIKDMPVTVVVGVNGTSAHAAWSQEWQMKIGKIPVAAA